MGCTTAKMPDNEVDALIAIRDTWTRVPRTCIDTANPTGWDDLHCHREPNRCEGIQLDENGHVSSMLPPVFDKVEGMLPPVFGVFSEMKLLRARRMSLVLHGNKVSWPIPDFSQCRCLTLELNGFDGTIPDFSRCTRLDKLCITGQDGVGTITGTLPTSWPQSLKELHVNYCKGVTGKIPDFSPLTRLEVLDLSECNFIGSLPLRWPQSLKSISVTGNKQLTGTIPDFSGLTQLESVSLNRCNFGGSVPAAWPASLDVLLVNENPDLAGDITAKLILQCSSIDYSGCKGRWNPELRQTNKQWMKGPFVVGASMASEEIKYLLRNREEFNISPDMLVDSPAKGDSQYSMTHNIKYGQDWVAWQEVWLMGLRSLRDRKVFVLAQISCAFFKPKFERSTGEEENTKNCFDPQYELPGEPARCILDWERRQLLAVAETNNLRIVYLGSRPATLSSDVSLCEVPKPFWYY